MHHKRLRTKRRNFTNYTRLTREGADSLKIIKYSVYPTIVIIAQRIEVTCLIINASEILKQGLLSTVGHMYITVDNFAAFLKRAGNLPLLAPETERSRSATGGSDADSTQNLVDPVCCWPVQTNSSSAMQAAGTVRIGRRTESRVSCSFCEPLSL